MSDEQLAPARYAAARRVHLSEQQLHRLAWGFLGSEFAGLIYADWPVDRRLAGYLRHHGMSHIVYDGDAHDAVLQHVLTNVGPALRNGILSSATWLTSQRRRDVTPAKRNGFPCASSH